MPRGRQEEQSCDVTRRSVSCEEQGCEEQSCDFPRRCLSCDEEQLPATSRDTIRKETQEMTIRRLTVQSKKSLNPGPLAPAPGVAGATALHPVVRILSRDQVRPTSGAGHGVRRLPGRSSGGGENEAHGGLQFCR